MRSMRGGLCIALLLIAPVVGAGICIALLLVAPVVGAAEEVETIVKLLDRSVPATIDVGQPDRPIVSLDLYNLRLANDDLATIAALPKLRTLHIGYNQFLTSACLKRLKKATSLRSLSVPWGTTDAGLSELKQLKGLESLSLPHSRITDAGIAHLKELESLTELNLCGTDVTGVALTQLHGLKKLRSLGVGQRFGDDDVRYLKGFGRLVALK
jgi:hypothetical protein